MGFLIVYPPEKKEIFTLTGSGTLTLTEEQRQAKTLSISIEKIKVLNYIDYYNLSTPEPRHFWGYLQLVQRDFVERTVALEYRRQVVRSWDIFDLDPVEQLRCELKDSVLLIFDLLRIMATGAGINPLEIAVEYTKYLISTDRPRILPTDRITAIWYKIEAGRAGQVSIIWQPNLVGCDPDSIPQYSDPARSPGAGESGSDGGGGGGSRPGLPPPPERAADAGSDSPAPPPSVPGGPPSPELGPNGLLPVGPYQVRVKITSYQSGNAPCIESPGGPGFVEYFVPLGPATVNKDDNPGGQGYTWRLVDNEGVRIVSIIGSSDFSDCDAEVEIASQVLIVD